MAKLLPGERLHVYEPFCFLPSITRKLDLRRPEDRHLLIEAVLRTDAVWTADQASRAISAIATFLEDDWLTVYSRGVMLISLGPGIRYGMSAFSELVPVGLALDALRGVPGFPRLLQKLGVLAHERIGAILEALTSAAYALAGYPVELEPQTTEGVHPDFRVQCSGEWIYGECKRENVPASKYFANAGRIANQMIDEVSAKCGPIPSEYRIDAFLCRTPNAEQRLRFVERVDRLLQEATFAQWVPVEQLPAAVAINPRSQRISRPPGFSPVSNVAVGERGAYFQETAASTQVFVRSFGSREIQKVRGLLVEAKKQLPTNARGMVFLEIDHTEAMVPVISGRLKLAGVDHVGGVLLTGNGAFFLPGPKRAIPIEFARIPAMGLPRMLPRFQ